jgi:hypothetical protein
MGFMIFMHRRPDAQKIVFRLCPGPSIPDAASDGQDNPTNDKPSGPQANGTYCGPFSSSATTGATNVPQGQLPKANGRKSKSQDPQEEGVERRYQGQQADPQT